MSLSTTNEPDMIDGWSSGRHAFREEAALTPIFNAVARGVRAGRRPASGPVGPGVDPVDAFHRDPLTAPIPVQALVAVPSQPSRAARRPVTEMRPAQGGRHHLRRPTS